jgi:hypothetical protein
MPIAYSIDREQGFMHSVAEGLVTLRDVRLHLEQERGDHGLGLSELVDARRATLAFDPTQVRQIVAVLRELAQGHDLGPTAVLVSSDYSFGMLRMLETLVEDVCAIRPFRDEAEAREWLRTQRPAPPRHPPAQGPPA